ncbi:MAG: ThuA domain-containing protein [Chitinophagaceae bacterium]|nr:ThuA domain-containing protein [Chitinophagaceae bacterium]
MTRFLPFAVLTFSFFISVAQQPAKKVLVYSGVNRYYHQSIPAGQAALQNIGKELNIHVDTTSDPKYFTEELLKNYAAVVFLSTSGNNLLDTSQKADFERFIQAGGGYMGIHGAAATEYGWTWYGKLLGAVFNGHPEPQEGVVRLANRKHPSTKHLPKKWKRLDEWYNYKNRLPDLNVLLTLDEKSYKGGTDGEYHPIAWYHEFDGGRSFYTGLGHTAESYSDPKFFKHLKAGLEYAIGNNVALDYSKAKTQRIILPSHRLLVFSKTKGWHHTSIPFGIKAVLKIANDNNYAVDTTVNADDFNDKNLQKYDAVIFMSTTGNVLNAEQQAAFERYIQSGGGYVGVHSAADTEYDWPWYGNLVGAYFESHPNNPNVRRATVMVTDKNHPASSMLPDSWERTDEWYNYKSIYSGIKVIMKLDEGTYDGGTNGADHPISWYHEYDGGRAFYTGLGHTDETYSEQQFIEHLTGGIKYAIGNDKRDTTKSYSRVTPDQNRFVKTVLTDQLDNPMELAVAPDGRIFFTELRGRFFMFDPKTEKRRLLYKFPITFEGGTGLIGITLDPQFMTNRWIYLYYAPGGLTEENLHFNLSRFTLNEDNAPDLKSEKILLTVPVQKNSGSHHGGSLAWDKHGNLFLSTGDGTTPFPSNGYAPIDERPGKEYYSMDAQRSAANTNDLKGKILRIHPEPDGTYTIPEGNLFPKGMEKTRPEIYVMGTRNPYRIAVNPVTSVVYWGEIGPDAGEDSTRGPKGYDEFNQAKKPGNYGWPYFVGFNRPYSEWDFATRTAGPLYDPKAPVNNSPNNTGLRNLPPATPPFIAYPYVASEQFPELGSGGRCAIGGDFYQFDKNLTSVNKFPEYYDGTLFIADWMRNWVFNVQFDKDENFKRTEPFMPLTGDFRRPIDMAFGKDGLLYMLEYGSVYGATNPDARLVKIEYNSGNRAPVAKANIVDSAMIDSLQRTRFLTSEASKLPVVREIAGQAPLSVRVSSRGSRDLDDDDTVSFEWSFGDDEPVVTTRDARHTYSEPGIYTVLLQVSDQEGLAATDTLSVKVGNSRPDVSITSSGNKSFAWKNKPFKYSITVSDKEDGKVDMSKIKAYYFYNPQPSKDENAPVPAFVEIDYPGKNIMAKSDCKSCHFINKKAVGPSYISIANRYKNQSGSVSKLADKIISGGGGSWGKEFVMSAHPQLTKREAESIVKYIYSLTDKKSSQKAIPLMGQLNLPFYDHEPAGQYTIVATYTDKGGKVVGPLKGTDVVTIRNAKVNPMYADEYPGFPRFGDNLSAGKHKAYILLRNVDLDNIREFSYLYSAKNSDGFIEVRLDSRAGPVVSKTPFRSTGSWSENSTISATLDRPVSGRHDVYFFVLKDGTPDNSGIINLKEINFQ